MVASGIRSNPAERISVGVDAVWTSSRAGLDPLRLAAPDWAATHPAQSYDFSLTDGYSDLNVGRLDVTLDARYRLPNDFWLDGQFRHARSNDREIYLLDNSGRMNLWSFSVGRAF